MIKRQQVFYGQQRVDAPHLRSLESSLCNDIDLLAGTVMAGSKALVITGFDLITSGAVGGPATSLQLNVAGGILFHPNGSESGTIFSVASGTAVETLSGTNANIDGSFTPGETNYIGLDLRRAADASTSDLVEFLDANTLLETPLTLPLARTLSYRIIISTIDFSSDPTVLPVARVETDASNVVISIEDARQMMFRLGSGGSAPNVKNAFTWTQNRNEDVDTLALSAFTGGDKAISNQKDFYDAIMSRLWELGGGDYWYSPTSDRDVKLTLGPVSTLTDNFIWDPTSPGTIKWEALSVIFANSTGTYNTITDNTSTGLTLPDGYCLYVDIDRSSNAILTVPAAVAMTSLGSPTVPGSRFVLAWRRGTSVWTRTEVYETGRQWKAASSAVGSSGFGVVRLSVAGTTYPTVIPLDANGRCVNATTGGNTSAFVGTGYGTGVGIEGIGSSAGSGGLKGTSTSASYPGIAGYGIIGGIGVAGTGGTGVAANGGAGVAGTGGSPSSGSFNGGRGITGTGGTSAGSGTGGTGGYFAGGATGGIGVEAQGQGDGHGVSAAAGAGTGNGVYAVGGTSTAGVYGLGGSPHGRGVEGHGVGSGYGVYGVGSGTAAAVYGTGGTTGPGVEGLGGATSAGGIGVKGTGGGTNAIGVSGIGGGTGSGVKGQGGASGGYGGEFVGTIAATACHALGANSATPGAGMEGIGGNGTTNGAVGVYGTGGTGTLGGYGGYFTGGATNGGGVYAVGGTGGTSGTGGTFIGGGSAGYGIEATGIGSGLAALFTGNVKIVTGEFSYNATQTRTLRLGAGSFTPYKGASIFGSALGVGGADYCIGSLASHNSYAICPLNIPVGSIITAIKAYTTTAATASTVNVTLIHRAVGAGPGYAVTVTTNAFAIAGATAAWGWHSATVSSPVTINDMTEVQIEFDSTPFDLDLAMQILEITYTTTAISGATV